MKNNFSRTFNILLALFIALIFSQCKDKNGGVPKVYNEAFNQYITAFTDYEISRETPIVVRFVEGVAQENEVGTAVDESIFAIEPKIEGNATWKDNQTIEFKPSKLLPSNQSYVIEVAIDKLFKQVPDSLETFVFSVKTVQQYYRIVAQGLRTGANNDITTQRFVGEIHTADIELLETVKASIIAQQDGSDIDVFWGEPLEGQTKFPFEIKDIKRKKTKSTLKIEVKNSLVASSDFHVREVEIPLLGAFNIIGHKVYSQPDQYVEIEFSDPLDSKQNIKGLVSISGFDYTSSIEGNMIKVFLKGAVSGTLKMVVSKGIKNIVGNPCKEGKAFDVMFIEHDPEVKLLGKGTIIPQGEILPFPFEAVNLSAVDVRIIKINENNIPQFLQVNRLEGSYQLRRVGEIVAQKKVALDSKLNLKDWNQHVIDLSELIQTEPGAIYRVALGFKKEYSLYSCIEEDTIGGDNMLDLGSGWGTPEEGYYDDEYDDYYDSYYSYSWKDRKNPCKSAYYHNGRTVERNLLASNIGLIAKKGSNDEFFFASTDLRTTEPMTGVTFEIYNYQQRVLKTFTSDTDGWASGKVEGNPYLLVAKKGKQRGYLRLDNGTALSLSNFDVSGNTYRKGLKGFIYGERGVWRPGDDIFLTFILEDKEQVLPVQHPVNLEFTNPKGQVVDKKMTKHGLNGFYHFKLKTDQDAPTGNYSVKIYAGGNTFYKTLKIETIQPNRLKINFNVEEEALYAFENQTALLESKWLHGAKAKHLKTDVAVQLSKAYTTFKGYEEYTFDFAGKSFYADRQIIFDGKLDADGLAEIPLKLEINDDAPGMLKANFSVKVFEPGGNFSTDAFSMNYHPYEAYVGIKSPTRERGRYYYDTDKTHQIELALMDTKGKPMHSTSKVQVSVYKLGWRWWWDDGANQVGYYNRNSHNKHSNQTVEVNNGKGTFDFKAEHDSWGRYLIVATNEFGHKSSKIIYVDWPGYSRTSSGDNQGAKMLTFTADKEKYETGEDITLNIPTPKKGRILVTIEDGNKVLSTKWLNATGETTKYTFKATPEMSPSCYAYTMLLQPQGSTDNDLPLRMYGVIPLNIENPASILEPKIKMPNELAPMSEFEVKVSESNGKPMTYTIAMVDEGLLDLTRYQTPDVWTAFNQRQALAVKTWDCFDDVANAQFDKVKNLLSIGGDMEAAGADSKKANRFKPVVYYAGPFYVHAGQTKIHKIKMPNYVGSVKTMVVAGNDFAYGNAEQVTPVKKPLMVLGTMPRVVSPRERIKFPVTVFAMKDHVKDVSLTLEQNGMFKNMNSQTQQIRFTEQGDQMVEFDLQAIEKTGIAKLKVTAKSGKESAVFEVELDIRSPNPKTTDTDSKMLEEGKTFEKTVALMGMDGTNKLSVELSSTPPINLEDRLDFLIRYPYGCVEQTVSSVFPQLYLNKLLKLSEEQKSEIEFNVTSGINRLTNFQTTEGGFAYWPGNQYSNEWGTNYAGHFMLEAEKAGFSVPEGLFKEWKKYQRKMARDYHKTDQWYRDMTQAYRLYVLAKAGSPELGAMNRMKTQGVSDKVKWYLAAAYYYAGQRNIGQELIKSLNTNVPNYQQFGYTYGSATRDKAIILEVLTLMNATQESSKIALELSKELSSDRWMSTQTTAYSLVSMAKYTIANPTPDKLTADIYINGEKESVNSDLSIATVVAGNLKQNNEVKIINKSNGSLYAKIINSGVPMLDNTADGANLMGLNVEYKTLTGQSLDQTSIEQGTDFKMVVTVRNISSTLHLKEVALNTMMPSGWEIHNSRMTGIEVGKSDAYDFQDVRDDRIYTFFDLQPNHSKTFTFFLNASYIGEYFQPSILVSPMYDASIYAHKKGQKVNVVKQVVD